MFIHRKKSFWFCLLLIAAFALSGCVEKYEQTATSNFSRTLIDGLGRPVRVPATVERAVSLAPSITETVFAAGAGDRLVGVTSYCNYPAEAASIAKVGDTQSPSVERIVALKPQLVLVSADSQLEAFTETLNAQGIAVYVAAPENYSEVVAAIREIGNIFGTEQIAEQTANEMEQRAEVVRRRVAGEPSKRVFIQISNEPLFSAGQGSFITEIVELAGGNSVTADIPSAYPRLSKETAAAAKPDVLILSASEDNREPNPVLSSSPAVRNGKVFRVNADIISRPGPRLSEALEEIAALLHPEKF